MSNPFRTRLHVEGLDARITPSAAFRGLDVATSRFIPTDPCMTASPVFALNYGTGDAWNGHALAGLNVAVARHYPTDPTSPIFVGLSGGSVDAPPA